MSRAVEICNTENEVITKVIFRKPIFSKGVDQI